MQRITIELSDKDYTFLEAVSKALNQNPSDLLTQFVHLFLSVSAKNADVTVLLKEPKFVA